MKMVTRFLSVLALLAPCVAAVALSPSRALAEPPLDQLSRASSSRGTGIGNTIGDPHVQYLVSATATSGGTIAPAGNVTVQSGADQTFIFEAAPHYHLLDVQIDGVSMGAVSLYTFSGVNADHEIEAFYAIDRHTLSASATTGGTVSRAPDQASYAFGETVVLTATSDPGYVFTEWSGDVVDSAPVLTVNVDADRSVIAHFARAYVLSATAASGGTILPAGPVTVLEGSDLTFSITPDAHHHVADVLVDGVSVGAATSYAFTGISGAHTIEASFAIDTHVLVVDAAHGAVTRDPDLQNFDYGALVALRPDPDPGYRFNGWSGDASGADVPLSIAMTADVHVTAGFVESVPPVVQLLAPAASQLVSVGESFEIRWSAADETEPGLHAGGLESLSPAGVVAVDLLISRTGAAGPYQSLATGLPNTGSYAWTVDEPITGQAVLKVVAHDAAGNTAETASGLFFVQNLSIVPIVWLRADSASGSGHYAVPGNTSPWVDVAGNHDATLWNFTGTAASGWKGDGTPANPYRLEFAGEEQGSNTHVTIPGGSIPELQSLGATTTSVWFKTGFDGPNSHYDYILEWVQRPATPFDPVYEGRGMSIIVNDGLLKVYANPWIDVTPVQPNTWYHVAVVKDTNDMRIYLNGQRVHTGTYSHRGTQESELVLGASTFRVFEGFPYPYSDFFTGAIAQVMVAQGAMSDAYVQALFAADRDLYLPEGLPSPLPLPDADRLVTLRAHLATGTTPYSSPGDSSPWVDLRAPANNGALAQFNGNLTSGWQGNGTAANPYCLRFDGVDDHVVIPARSIAELQNATAYAAEMWVKPGTQVLGPDYRYLFEWLAGQGSASGMSLAIANGTLQLFTGTPYWADLGPISADVWHHVVVAKQPGEVRIYLDGNRIYTGLFPNIGDQGSEVVIGASTWRGPHVYGDFLPGDVGAFTIWEGALTDQDVMNAYLADRGLSFGVAGIQIARSRGTLSLAGFRPNPVGDRLRVALVLATSEPASLELIDVTGRRVRSREIGSLGPGQHLVDLGDAQDVHAGLYFLRVTQSGLTRTAKATIVR
jgi:uncharacterized repeat protein (TIGR02543 family)